MYGYLGHLAKHHISEECGRLFRSPYFDTLNYEPCSRVMDIGSSGVLNTCLATLFESSWQPPVQCCDLNGDLTVLFDITGGFGLHDKTTHTSGPFDLSTLHILVSFRLMWHCDWVGLHGNCIFISLIFWNLSNCLARTVPVCLVRIFL